jgi:phosphoenolpyruvate carboxylase
VADLLLAREETPLAERRVIEEALDGEVELLWITAEVRQDRPSVKDEVSTVLWYLETRLLDAGARARDALIRAFEEEFNTTSDAVQQLVPLRVGTWVGGDRDGNPSSRPTSRSPRRDAQLRHPRPLRRRSLVSWNGCRCPPRSPPSDELRRRSRSTAAAPRRAATNSRRNADEPCA